MSTPRYETGKAGAFVYNAANTYFSQWSATVEKAWAAATDSSGYDPTTNQLWKKQAAGSIAITGSIEGYFDFNAGTSALLTTLLSDAPVAAIFKYDQTTPFCSGLITLKNFKSGVEVEGGTTIGFTCDFESYGVMNILS